MAILCRSGRHSFDVLVPGLANIGIWVHKSLQRHGPKTKDPIGMVTQKTQNKNPQKIFQTIVN